MTLSKFHKNNTLRPALLLFVKLLAINAVCFLALKGLSSCTPEPVLQNPGYEPRLVIDGSIEQGDFPRVSLTYSSSYFTEIDSSKIRKLVIASAKVTVSDGETEEVLTLKKDARYFPPYIYQGTAIKGEIGKNYKLTVEAKNKKYTAITSIPDPAQLVNLWFELSQGSDSIGYLYGEIADDPAKSNYYRLFTKRKHKDSKFVPVYLSAVSDQYFNGKKFKFSILRGPESLTDVIDDLYFLKGDTIQVKLCTMDKAHFDFWRTLERELYVLGNPFSSSGNEIMSNIDDKTALGVWGGYGVKYYQIIAK